MQDAESFEKSLKLVQTGAQGQDRKMSFSSMIQVKDWDQNNGSYVVRRFDFNQHLDNNSKHMIDVIFMGQEGLKMLV